MPLPKRRMLKTSRPWRHFTNREIPVRDDRHFPFESYDFNDCLEEHAYDFPTDYPTSVLLGCVDVMDCVDRATYLEQYPSGESDSEYVLICENPQELFFKLPMRGQHKICEYRTSCLRIARLSLSLSFSRQDGQSNASRGEKDSPTENAIATDVLICLFFFELKARAKKNGVP